MPDSTTTIELYDPNARPARRILGIRLKHFNGWSILYCHLVQFALIAFGVFRQSSADPEFSMVYVPIMSVGLVLALFINLRNRQTTWKRKLVVAAWRSVVCVFLLVLNPLTVIPLSLLTTSVTREEVLEANTQTWGESY